MNRYSLLRYIVIAPQYCYAQDAARFKSNELVFSCLGDRDINGASIICHRWKTENKAHRIGLQFYTQSFSTTTTAYSIAPFVPHNRITTDELKYYVSYGQLYQKKVFPNLSVFLAFDVLAGLYRNSRTTFYQDPVYTTSTIDRYGFAWGFVPTFGSKINCGKVVTFNAEFSFLPVSMAVGVGTFDFNKDFIQSQLGVGFRI